MSSDVAKWIGDWLTLEERALSCYRLKQRIQTMFGKKKIGLLTVEIENELVSIRKQQDLIIYKIVGQRDWTDFS